MIKMNTFCKGIKYFVVAGNAIEDETKRPRKSNQDVQRLYPALSDLESNASYGSDNAENYCTTATASALSTADEMKSAETQPLRGHHHDNDEPDDENEDRCAESFYSCLLFLLCID